MPFFMKQGSLVWALLCSVHPFLAFFKVPCSTPLVIQRADLINQSGVASYHVHNIMGGSGPGTTMDYNVGVQFMLGRVRTSQTTGFENP